MKNLKNTFAILTIIGSILLSNLTFAAKGSADSTNFLQINGRVLKAIKNEKGGYIVELVKENKVIEYQMVKPKMNFAFDLSKNSQYTLRVSKVGFLPFVISIDTKLTDENSKTYAFNFDVELIPLPLASKNQKKKLGEPIAVLKHDEKKDTFFPVDLGSEISNVF